VPEHVALGAADVREMTDLVTRTEPGPWRPRTVEFGGYVGVRDGGALVAMAGERMRPPGFTEISAVCTEPAYRGRGLAGGLTRVVAAAIAARGDRPMLHASALNAAAVRLYESLGFRQARPMVAMALRAPD
jgi:predicted GNAT family acetyltransferase